jgi:hypothetical protein
LQGDPFWHNIATDATQRDKPVLKRGGILADEMGKQATTQRSFCSRVDLWAARQDWARLCKRLR